MQFQKKEKRQTTVRFDSHHVRLRTGEVQRKTGSYMYRWTDKLGKRNTIYMNLKEIRVSRRLKVQEVSDYLSCLPSVYSRYENGKREPSIDILLKLSKLYSVSVDYLIGNDEVIDTSITEKEAAMISAMRQADERARQDAIALLELHTVNKKI